MVPMAIKPRLPGYALGLILCLLALPAQAGLRVFACEPEWAALARALVPEADITTATSYLQDPHYIEARPSLIAAMSRADIALCTGASLEGGWLPTLLQRAANPVIQPGREGLFLAAEQVELHSAHDHVDRSMGDVHPEGNPHVHLAPDRVPVIMAALVQRLQALQPASAAAIQTRYVRWRVRWNNLRSQWQAAASQLEGRSVVVQHASFAYLLRWLGIAMPLDLEPKPGLPPSAGHLNTLLGSPELERVSAILIASHQGNRGAQWLSEQSGKPVLTLPGTVTGEPGTDTLGDLISRIVSALLETAGDQSGG